jgi:hypothetical protein
MEYNLMTLEQQAKEAEIIRKWFNDHEAKLHAYVEVSGPQRSFIGHAEEVIWRNKSGSSTYGVNYMFSRGTLVVTGDLGDAVYIWHPSIGNISALAGLELHYFSEKCQASPVGRGYKSWDFETAKEGILYRIDDIAEERESSSEELLQEFKQTGGMDSLFHQNEWVQWLYHSGNRFFGTEYWELGEIGFRPDIHCHSHLVGLKMAFEQLDILNEKKEDVKNV